MKAETTGFQYANANRYRAEGREEGRKAGRAEGRVEGEATTALKVLEIRGIAISDKVRARITEAKDRCDLDRWLTAAMHADSADDLVRLFDNSVS